ncbi:MAG TPA: NAD(P)H-hydrate dehydratase [Thermoplasmata archaeon]|nr:NAD(P)H-hydrate dehydratase [Thermoplasmata archaeon]
MWVASPRPLTAEEMAVAELNAVALGVTLDTLMENAGRAVAEEAARHLPPPPARVAVVASTGNNGGDGTCAAFYLQQWGFSPEIWLVHPPSEIRSRSARRCFERIERRLPVHLRIPRPEDLATMPLVVDALLGTGQSEHLRPPILEAVRAIRASKAPVLSVDLPTGTRDPVEGLRPSWTVTLTAPKAELDAATAGTVSVRDIGIPVEAWRRTGPGEFAFFRAPTGRSDRGRTARIVIVGGGPYSGAPALAGLAALRTGAERATILAPAGAAERIQAFSPNLVVRPFGGEHFRPTDVGEILDYLRAAPPRAVAVGMGAGAHPETLSALAELIPGLARIAPTLVDADGLGALPSGGEWNLPDGAGRPLATPNAGEFARLVGREPSGLAARIESARALAADRRLFLVVKGDPDLLTDGETLVENRHHHPAMTVAGVGDVLAGAIVSLLGQGLPALSAARLGTYWTGEAGILAASRKSFGLVATDLLEELPAALSAGLARIHRAA